MPSDLSILFVENDEGLSEPLKLLLELNYRVNVDLSNNSADALRKGRTRGYDVVLMDVGESTMPGSTRPYDLVEKIRRLKPEALIIGYSGARYQK